MRKETDMEFKSDKSKTWLEDDNGKQIALLDHPEVRPGVVNIVHTEVGKRIKSRINLFICNPMVCEAPGIC